MSHYVVLCTTPTKEEALLIASKLIENRLAACVNLQDNITSIYQWEGKICQDTETLMIIKTQKALFKDLKAFIKTHHSYDVPEIIALPIEQGNKAYLQWIETNTKGTN